MKYIQELQMKSIERIRREAEFRRRLVVPNEISFEF